MIFSKIISFSAATDTRSTQKYESKKHELKELKTNLVWISKPTATRTTRKNLGLDLKSVINLCRLKELKTNLVWISKVTGTRTTRKNLGHDLKFLKVDLYEFFKTIFLAAVTRTTRKSSEF